MLLTGTWMASSPTPNAWVMDCPACTAPTMANGLVRSPTPSPSAPHPVKGDATAGSGLTGPAQTVHCSMPPIRIGASASPSPSRFSRTWYGIAPRAGAAVNSIAGNSMVGTGKPGAGASGLTAMTPALANATPAVNTERMATVIDHSLTTGRSEAN